MKARHILGLSGGRDSAALAIFMRENYPELDLEFYFTDTGKELPEVYEFLDRLEGFLGRTIVRLNPDRDFDFWLREYHHFLPSPQSRWCTRQLKLRPLEQWLRHDLDAGVVVHSYVAIRADEPSRQGYQSTCHNMHVHLPFKKVGIDRKGVREILDGAGVGEPAYYQWRSRSGCTFCFFQQKIEWIRLMQVHPDAFADAKSYEKTARAHGAQYTWNQGESLEELSRPERVAQIEVEWEVRNQRTQARRQANPLAAGLTLNADDIADIYEADAGCLVCHK